MKVKCEQCGAILHAPTEAVGNSVRCPKCKCSFTLAPEKERASGETSSAGEAPQKVWHLGLDGAAQGPFSQEEVRALIRDGRVGPDTLAWRDGMAEWVQVQTVDGLRSLLPSRPAPPPLPLPQQAPAPQPLPLVQGQPRAPAPPARSDPGVESAAASLASAWQRFRGWNVGAKMVLITSCVAVVSLFLPWVDIGIISRNAFGGDGFLLIGFYIYPLILLFTGKRGVPILGVACGVVAALGAVVFISRMQSNEYADSVNFAGSGVLVFLVASIVMAVGAYLDRSAKGQRPPSPYSAGR